jgi:transposase-like protein
MRWTPRRKAQIVFDIREGEISVAQAKERYALSDEELAAWIRDYDARGLSGLKVYDLRRRLCARCGASGSL